MYYEKNSIRHQISKLLKTLFADAGHREKFVLISKDRGFFVKFVNMLMNDCTKTVDDGLGYLTEIKGVQDEMDDEAAFAALSDEDRKSRKSVLADAERMAPSSMVSHELGVMIGVCKQYG